MLDEPPSAADTSRGRGGRWLLVGAGIWALLLAVGGYYSSRNDPPTVREQRSIAQAAPVVDRAVGELVVAAGSDVVLELSGRRLASGCRLTSAWDGATLERTLTVRTLAADAPARLDRIAERLPAAYEAQTRHRGPIHRLRADAGDFVAISGLVSSAGVVTLTVTTGCRPPSPDFAAEGDLAIGRPVGQVATRVLTDLGATGIEPQIGTAVACAGGGAVEAARAVGRGTAPAAARRKASGAGAVVVMDKPDVYAYRSGPTSVVIKTDGDRLTVTAATSCQ